MYKSDEDISSYPETGKVLFIAPNMRDNRMAPDLSCTNYKFVCLVKTDGDDSPPLLMTVFTSTIIKKFLFVPTNFQIWSLAECSLPSGGMGLRVRPLETITAISGTSPLFSE